MRITAVAAAVVGISIVPVASFGQNSGQQQMTEFDKKLLGLPYNKELLIEQVMRSNTPSADEAADDDSKPAGSKSAGSKPVSEPASPPAASLPAASAEAVAEEKIDSDASQDSVQQEDKLAVPSVTPARAFAPGGRPAAASSSEAFDFSGPLALILPLNASGFVGQAAEAFLLGFERAAQADEASLAVDIYSTDGRAVSGLAAYQQAVDDGAGSILGPMLRDSANAIAALNYEEQVPTLLLQQPEIIAGASPKMYSFPLGAEVEAVQFVDTVASAAERTMVVIDKSAYGTRLANAIRSAWGERNPADLAERQIDDDDAWHVLHNELRGLLVEMEDSETPDPVFPVIFIAGGKNFAARARLNVPSAFAIHVPASSYSGADQRASTHVVASTGVRFFETAWLAEPSGESVAFYEDPQVRKLDATVQRFYAAGIDAFVLISNYAEWTQTNFWQGQGATGMVELRNRSFVRSGRLVELRDGRIIPVGDG